jgi:hypothetical protein
MKAHGIDCCQRRTKQRRWARGAAGGAVFTVLAALMPKCPLCIAAWLGVLGLSGVVSRVDPRAVWLFGAAATALAAAALVQWFLGRRRQAKEGDGT